MSCVPRAIKAEEKAHGGQGWPSKIQFHRRLAKKTAVTRPVIPRCCARSASAERLFGDAGYQEGTRRQGTGSPVTEMLLMVRSYVVAHLNSPLRQAGFISNRAQAGKELAEAIATELEEWNY